MGCKMKGMITAKLNSGLGKAVQYKTSHDANTDSVAKGAAYASVLEERKKQLHHLAAHEF